MPCEMMALHTRLLKHLLDLEIGQERFMKGAAERGLANLPKVSFIQADISESKHWEHADVVYVASLCFADCLMLALVEAATALKDGTQ